MTNALTILSQKEENKDPNFSLEGSSRWYQTQ